MSITKEMRVRQLPSFPEGGQFTSEGDSLLRGKLSGGQGTLYYVVNCPGGTLLVVKCP